MSKRDESLDDEDLMDDEWKNMSIVIYPDKTKEYGPSPIDEETVFATTTTGWVTVLETDDLRAEMKQDPKLPSLSIWLAWKPERT
jgi:hypothetical protein